MNFWRGVYQEMGIKEGSNEGYIIKEGKIV